MSVLGKRSLLALLEARPPLVEGLLAPLEQVQPNGIDLTLREIASLCSRGQIGVANTERRLSGLTPMSLPDHDYLDLTPGSYLITFNEIVHLPKDIMALGRPRSSLLRCAVNIHTAVWDAGYEGRSQALLVVNNPHGFRLTRNARLMQLVFIRLTEETPEGYSGIFQRENISQGG